MTVSALATVGHRRPCRRWQQLAADLDGVIDALALPRPLVVVGHSLGGPIAMAGPPCTRPTRSVSS